MSQTSQPKALVVGGGIGGLAAALALANQGVQIELLEQAETIGEIGAGIQLAANAFAALDALGVGEAARGRSVFTDHITLRDAIDRSIIAQVDVGAPYRERFGNPYAVIHRADIHLSILEAVQRNPLIQFRTATRVVSLAQLKVHRTATVTMAIKNIAMSYPCAEYYGYPRVKQERHPHNILKDKQAFLVGMALRFPIHLAIVSGHPAMIGTGPIGGKAVETGLVIAGRNAVAVDSVGAFLLGFETNGVQHLRQAVEVGLGETYMSPDRDGGEGRLVIEGLPVKEAVKVFRTAAYGEAF